MQSTKKVYQRKLGLCKVCGKPTSTIYYTRCQQCRIIQLIGNNHPNWENKTVYCKDCNKVIDGRSKYCLSCYRKKHVTKEIIYTHCIDCGKFKGKSYGYPRCKSCANSGKQSHRRGKTAHGKKFKYKGFWLKSGYEYIYAKYLTRKNIRWLYEPKAFDLKNEQTYIPDFYLPETNEWVEIKGWWRGDALYKFNRFKRIYPDLIINILGRTELTRLGLITPGGKYKIVRKS